MNSTRAGRFGQTTAPTIRIFLGSVILALFTLQAQAALYSRLDGAVYYDDVRDLSWMTNTNYAALDLTPGRIAEIEALGITDAWAACGACEGQTHTLGAGSFDFGSDGNPTGLMNFWAAQVWADTLEYGGNSNWRLAHSTEITGLYGTELAGSTASGPFAFSQPGIAVFWSHGEFYNGGVHTGCDRTIAVLEPGTGFGTDQCLEYDHGAWVVTEGDVFPVSQVPLPAAAWLFASALAGLLGRKAYQ